MADRDATTPRPAIIGEPAAPAEAPQWRKPQRHTYGAVDLGTNNCRLLIARPTGDSFTIIDAFSRIVRLGEGLGVSGKVAGGVDRSVPRGLCRKFAVAMS